MGLWSRLVSSMPYLKGDAPSYMETCVPKIARAYITSRYFNAQFVEASTSHPRVVQRVLLHTGFYGTCLTLDKGMSGHQLGPSSYSFAEPSKRRYMYCGQTSAFYPNRLAHNQLWQKSCVQLILLLRLELQSMQAHAGWSLFQLSWLTAT